MSDIKRMIRDQIVAPMVSHIIGDIDGYVLQVHYEDHVADIMYYEARSMQPYILYGVELPRDGDGVYRKSVENGDRVTVSFRNKSKEEAYISVVYKQDGMQPMTNSGGRNLRFMRVR
jgi:hypothetical protein